MISFYPASMEPSVRDALEDCARRGFFPGGYYASRVEALLGAFGAERALLTPSCTASLQIACRLAGIGPGDEVILPSYNFPAAANAVLLAGGTPVLCDIDPETQNLSVADAQRRITKRTRAVIAVHYAAVACDMDALCALCDAFGLTLIEDAAQAVGATYRGRHLGTMGRFGCYSFHATKVFSSGEGGALLCGREDSQRAELFRDNGTNREAFARGLVSGYDWQSPGGSGRMSELCAAALHPQLLRRNEIMAKRLAVHAAYDQALGDAARSGLVQTMLVPDGCRVNGHIYYVRLADGEARRRVQNALAGEGVPALTHYVPLHLSPMGARLGYRPEDLPESKKTYETLLRLPIHEEMTPEQAFYVAQRLLKAVGA